MSVRSVDAERDLAARQLAESLRAYRRGSGRQGSARRLVMGGSHTLAHLDRVYGLTRRLQSEEGGDPLILAAASFVHDYRQRWRTRPEDHSHDRKAVGDLVRGTMAAVGFPAELVPRVCDCVEFAGQDSPSEDALDASIEARIVHDANILDALGAVGIARAFMFGETRGEPIWLQPGIGTVDEPVPSRPIVQYFHVKLLRLKDQMLTEAGRTLAEARHDFMVLFLDALESERAFALDESYPSI